MSLVLVVTRPSNAVIAFLLVVILPSKAVTSFPIRVSTPSMRVLIVLALVVIAVFRLPTSVVTRPSKVLIAVVLVVTRPSMPAIVVSTPLIRVLVACNCLPVTASLEFASKVASFRLVIFVPVAPANVTVSLVAESYTTALAEMPPRPLCKAAMSLVLVVTRLSNAVIAFLLVVILPSKVVTSFPIRVSISSIRVLIVFALVVIAVFKLPTSVVTRPSNAVILVFVACNCLPVTASLEFASKVASCRLVIFVPLAPARVKVALLVPVSYKTVSALPVKLSNALST